MYKQQRNNYKTSIMAVLIASTIFYCGDPIPVEEMGNAKFEITKAANVKADVYAKEKYEKARATLFESHDMVSKNKLKEAKEKAIEAQSLAMEAYNQAVPELAKVTKNEAAQMIKEADRAYAEELAAESFKNANKLMTAGDEKMTAEKPYEAFKSYENSREEAIKARNQAEAQTENLQRELTSIEDLIKEAVKYGANESAPDKITEANNSAKRAHEYLSNKYLKDAHTEIVKAKENALAASETAKKDFATKRKIEAGAAVENAEKEMVNLKAELEKDDLKKKLSKSDESQESLKNTEETLSAAQASLNNAGLTLDKQKYSDSVEHSKEAMRLAQLVKDQVPALLVLIKQDKQPTKLSNQETKTGQETTAKGSQKPEELAEGWKSYSVRLIPERRDCLWRISEYKNIYGDPFKWTRIYKANKGQIKNPDLIYPGQVFEIPPATGDLTKPIVKPKKEESKPDESQKTIERPKMDQEKTPETSGNTTGNENKK
jgi:nucleoid-associated protein YgaU